MKIIGDKNDFAVEYQITDVPNFMGYGKIWIQNSFYGTNGDLIYIKGYLIPLIENILKAKTIDFDFKGLNDEELFKKLKGSSIQQAEYKIVSSTFTDDFMGFKYKSHEIITLIWQIRSDQELLFSDLKNYPKSIIKVDFNYKKGLEILNAFKQELKSN